MSIVHVIDDDLISRKYLGKLLGDEGFPYLAHSSAQSFLNSVGSDEQGCVVADLRPPGMTTRALLAEMKRLRLSLPIIAIGNDSVAVAVDAMKTGAKDFVSKPLDTETLSVAVRTALAARRCSPDETSEIEKMRANRATLSARANEVLTALTWGSPNKVIAYRLGLSVRTVEAHRANLMAKMHAKTKSELIRMSFLTAGFSARQ